MSESKDTNVRLLITLTPEEFETLKRVAEAEGKPVATVFMHFVREAKVFTVLKKSLKPLRHLLRQSRFFLFQI